MMENSFQNREDRPWRWQQAGNGGAHHQPGVINSGDGVRLATASCALLITCYTIITNNHPAITPPSKLHHYRRCLSSVIGKLRLSPVCRTGGLQAAVNNHDKHWDSLL